jgi:hypothetical protein
MLGKTLSSWKEIAKYLERDESTVRRWEKEKGLPVHRPGAGKGTSVYAYSEEIDDWLRQEKSSEIAASPAVEYESINGNINESNVIQAGSVIEAVSPAATHNAELIKLRKAKKAKWRFGRIAALLISMALGISIFGLLRRNFSGPTIRAGSSQRLSSSSTRSPVPAENDRITGSGPQISEVMQEKLIAEAKLVVKQSQIWEMLSLYAAPWNCDANDLPRYWEVGSKAFVDVGESVSRLNERGWHYGYGSRLLDFEFLSAKVSQDGRSAEIETREHWLLPLYTREGQLVASRNPDQGPYEINYLLTRLENRWYIKSTSTPYVAWKPKQISCRNWPTR